MLEGQIRHFHEDETGFNQPSLRNPLLRRLRLQDRSAAFACSGWTSRRTRSPAMRRSQRIRKVSSVSSAVAIGYLLGSGCALFSASIFLHRGHPKQTPDFGTQDEQPPASIDPPTELPADLSPDHIAVCGFGQCREQYNQFNRCECHEAVRRTMCTENLPPLLQICVIHVDGVGPKKVRHGLGLSPTPCSAVQEHTYLIPLCPPPQGDIAQNRTLSVTGVPWFRSPRPAATIRLTLQTDMTAHLESTLVANLQTQPSRPV